MIVPIVPIQREDDHGCEESTRAAVAYQDGSTARQAEQHRQAASPNRSATAAPAVPLWLALGRWRRPVPSTCWALSPAPTDRRKRMTMRQYQITWQPYTGDAFLVSLRLDSGFVAAASTRIAGVKEAPKKLELCELVRKTAALTRPALHMEQIHFDHLTIVPLS